VWVSGSTNSSSRYCPPMGCSSRMCWISLLDVGPKLAVRASEDIEEDPDRWCSSTECGQELWQMACQWVWNLRLTLGHAMQAGPTREMEWAPPKEAPPLVVAAETPPEEYGPWQWAAALGRATGRLGADAFTDAGRRGNGAAKLGQA
jgi:hypothetical protein